MKISRISTYEFYSAANGKKLILSFSSLRAIWLKNLFFKKQWVIVPDGAFKELNGEGELIKVVVYLDYPGMSNDQGTVYITETLYEESRSKLSQIIAIFETKLGKLYHDGNYDQLNSVDSFIEERL